MVFLFFYRVFQKSKTAFFYGTPCKNANLPRLPILNIRLTIDKLNIMRALGVAVAGPVLGARLVTREGKAAVLRHLHKVEGAVEAARQVAHVHVKGELFV